MKYTQEEFENICRPLSQDLNVDLSLGPKDSYDLRSLSRLCANRITRRLDWGVLGARILLQIIRASAGKTFSDATKKLEIYLNKDYFNFVMENAEILDKIPNEEKSNDKQAISIGTLETNYLLKYNKCHNCKKDCPECEKFYVGETPEQMYMRIATFLCMPSKEQSKQIDREASIRMITQCYHYLSDQKYSHATPTMYNAGCIRPQMASCFVLSVQDSLWSIEDYWTYVGEISRNSGGIGLDVSNIRHSHIANAGKSDGVPALLRPFESILNYVDQSKKRKGSAAIFLSVWHIDIEEFINLKVPVGAKDEKSEDPTPNLFYSVWVQDLFMKRVENDEEWTLFCPKRCPGLTEVWGDEFEKLYLEYEAAGRGLKKVPAQKLLQSLYLAQCKTGQPYICMADRFNQSNMQSNIGIIRSSNLCVAPETMILTDCGYYPIASLWGQTVNVWNGVEWSSVIVRKTGTDQKMVRVDFSNGSHLTCTEYHKFYLADGGAVPAHKLKKGMKLIKHLYPIVSNFEDDTRTVPINASSEIKLDWFKQVCQRFGKLSKKKNMHLHSENKEILFQIQLLLQTMSCNPQIVANQNGSFRLVIFARDLYILGVIGANELLPHLKGSHDVRVTNVTVLSQRSDTYCFREEKRGMGVFNGILTGQCSEIALHTSEKEIASCNLASLCLGSFVEDGQFASQNKTFNFKEFSQVVRFVVRVMNNVIDRNYYPERIDQIKSANLRNRPLGLGIQGLANVFAQLELMFDSKEARDVNNKIIQTMYYSAVDESANIAAEKGESYPAYPGSPYSQGLLHPDLWQAPDGSRAKFLSEIDEEVTLDFEALRNKVKQGIYNSTLLALMPTASSSIIAEQTPCFEPFNFIIGSKTLISGQFTHVCRDFAEDMEKLGVWSEELVNQIVKNDIGSTANLTIPDSIKDKPLKVARWNFLMDKYRTAYEIGPKASILQGIDRTPFVCQSQSLNWFVPKPSWKKFLKYVFQSWKKGAKTIVYYNRGTSSMKARSVATCTSCTG